MRIRDAVKDVLDGTTVEDLANYEDDGSRTVYVLYLII